MIGRHRYWDIGMPYYNQECNVLVIGLKAVRVRDDAMRRNFSRV